MDILKYKKAKEISADIAERLKDYKEGLIGQPLYDIIDTLTEYESGDGSWYYNEGKAIEDLNTNDTFFEEVSKVWYDEFNDGVIPPIKDYESHHCKLMILAYEMLFDIGVENLHFDKNEDADESMLNKLIEHFSCEVDLQ